MRRPVRHSLIKKIGPIMVLVASITNKKKRKENPKKERKEEREREKVLIVLTC